MQHRHTDKNTSCCTSRFAFIAKTDMPSPVYCASVHKTSILYKCIQNQFTVQVHTKPVNCTSVQKTSLLYKCTQNQFTVQVYTKPVHCASIHKISLLYKFTKPVYWLIMKGMYIRLIHYSFYCTYQPRHLTWVSQVCEKWVDIKESSVRAN